MVPLESSHLTLILNVKVMYMQYIVMGHSIRRYWIGTNRVKYAAYKNSNQLDLCKQKSRIFRSKHDTKVVPKLQKMQNFGTTF